MRVRNGRGVVEDYGPRPNWLTHDPAEDALKVARAKRSRSGNLKRNYGMTEDDFEVLWNAQGGVCAICRQPERVIRRGNVSRLSVDHDHASNLVRGLLCASCNAALGLLRDDPGWIRTFSERAVEYLDNHRRIQSGIDAYTDRG